MATTTETTTAGFTTPPRPAPGRAPLLVALLVAVAGAAGCDGEGAAGTPEVLPPQGVAFDAGIAAAEEPVVAPVVAPSRTGDPEPAAVAPVRPRQEGDARTIGFAELASFEYVAEDPLAALTRKRPAQEYEIPESIRALTGERVAVDGYLMPTIFESGRVTRFLLTRSYITCCFGDVLAINEVIDVTPEPGLTISYLLSGQPVTVTGWLEVGEKKSEFGYVESIYRIVAEKVAERW